MYTFIIFINIHFDKFSQSTNIYSVPHMTPELDIHLNVHFSSDIQLIKHFLNVHSKKSKMLHDFL